MVPGRRANSDESAATKPRYEFEAPRDVLAVLPATFGLIPLLVARGDPWLAVPFVTVVVIGLAWSSATAVIGSTNWYRTGLDGRLIALSGAGRDCRVLHAACGTGTLAVSFARLLRPAEVWATDRWKPTRRMPDPSVRTLDNVRSEGVDHIVQLRDADPLHLPFKTGYFNVVGSRYGISNARKDKRKILLEILRVLKPGGAIVLAETLPVALWLRYVVLARFSREYKMGTVSMSRFHFTGLVAAQKLG